MDNPVGATTERTDAHLNVYMDISYPPHIDRLKDPYYHIFLATRHQMVEVEKQACWRCGGFTELEAHHKIQWAFFNDLDMEKVRKDFPSYTGTTEDDKQKWLNSRENIIILCKDCHTGTHGRHKIPDPLWILNRYVKEGTPDVCIVQEKAGIKKKVRTVGNTVATSLPRPMGMKMSRGLQRLLK